MTGDEVTLNSVVERLDRLTDLFRRRLLEDRTKQTVIESLIAQLEESQRVQSVESLRPLVTHLALIIERLQENSLTEDLRVSIVDEMEDALSLLGVSPVATVGTIDPRYHQIVSVTGYGSDMRVGELVRAGYEKDGIVLRPALVTAVRVPSSEDPPSHNGEVV